jgi:molybdopterin converting factor small subunit
MVRITFPAVLARHVDCPPMDVDGATVRAALEAAFAVRPRLRGYVLDDAGSLRGHMAIFVDGAIVRDRRDLSDGLRDGAEIQVLQALSGG